jgi:hypothetical protein
MVTRSLAIDDPSSWFCRHETSKRGAALGKRAPGTKKNPATFFFLSPAIRKHVALSIFTGLCCEATLYVAILVVAKAMCRCTAMLQADCCIVLVLIRIILKVSHSPTLCSCLHCLIPKVQAQLRIRMDWKERRLLTRFEVWHQRTYIHVWCA